MRGPSAPSLMEDVAVVQTFIFMLSKHYLNLLYFIDKLSKTQVPEVEPPTYSAGNSKILFTSTSWPCTLVGLRGGGRCHRMHPNLLLILLAIFDFGWKIAGQHLLGKKSLISLQAHLYFLLCGLVQNQHILYCGYCL